MRLSNSRAPKVLRKMFAGVERMSTERMPGLLPFR